MCRPMRVYDVHCTSYNLIPNNVTQHLPRTTYSWDDLIYVVRPTLSPTLSREWCTTTNIVPSRTLYDHVQFIFCRTVSQHVLFNIQRILSNITILWILYTRVCWYCRPYKCTVYAVQTYSVRRTNSQCTSYKCTVYVVQMYSVRRTNHPEPSPIMSIETYIASNYVYIHYNNQVYIINI